MYGSWHVNCTGEGKEGEREKRERERRKKVENERK